MNRTARARPTILLLDDDEKLTSLLTEYLSGYDFEVLAAAHPREGLRLLAQRTPDLLVLDVMLPEMDGFAVCRKVRETSRVPIIMLTARGDVTDRVVGLEIGADDYLPKPFEPRELVARIQAVLRRRSAAGQDERLTTGRLTIDWGRREVELDGTALELTTAEFDLLGILVRSSGRVLSRDAIMSRTHGVDWEAFDRSVDVLISRLRQKLGDDPRSPQFIRTVRGAGYTFIGRSGE